MPSKVLVMWCMICNPTEPAVSGKGEFQQGGEAAVSHLNGGEEDFGIPKTKSSLQDRRGIKCWIHESGSLGPWRTNSDVVHFFLLCAFVEQLLKGDRIGRRLHRLLQALPGAAQFRRTIRITQSWRVEDLAMDGI